MKAETPHQHLSFSPNLIDLFLFFIFLFLVFATISQLPQAMLFAQTGLRPGVTTDLDLALRIIRDSSLLNAAIGLKEKEEKTLNYQKLRINHYE